jgi:hypothetical protein
VAIFKYTAFWGGLLSVWEGELELTDEQIEVIKEASREIDFGRITVSFTGSPSNVVDIVAEKHVRDKRALRTG